VKYLDDFDGEIGNFIKYPSRTTGSLLISFNPDPWEDMAIGAITQGIGDLIDPNLSIPQRAERVAVSAVESPITGFFSDAIGVLAFGFTGNPILGGIGLVGSSLLLDEIIWPAYNSTYFSAAGY